MDMFTYRTSQTADLVADFMRKVYAWMSLGLVLTGMVAWYIGSRPELVQQIFSNSALVIGLIIFQLGLVIGMTFLINKISQGVATLMFLLYATTLGITMSAIFVAYSIGTIYSAFFVSASMFVAMSIYGTVTKRDLTGLGSFLFMGLIGVIAATIVNMFLKNSMLDFVISCIGVLVFVGLTAYDTQKLRRIAETADENSMGKLVIMGALTLYLDFINLFLYILRLMGRRN